MSEIKTIHIFGFGETQCIGKEINKKVPSNSLNILESVIEDIRSKLPSEYNGVSFHSINIFISMFVDFIPKRNIQEDSLKPLRINYNEINTEIIDDLCTELMSFSETEN